MADISGKRIPIEIGARVINTDSQKRREGTVMQLAKSYTYSHVDEDADYAFVHYDSILLRDRWIHIASLAVVNGVTPEERNG